MRLILSVFDAMRSFNRSVTRMEIERESGLNKYAVEKGLCGLMRRGLLVIHAEPRKRGLYGLVPGAERPEDLRGKYTRDEEHRIAAAQRVHAQRSGGFVGDYSPARPPSHSAQPGALRIVVKGILDVRHAPTDAFAPCALEQAWKRR